jgi:hypothetical protein
MLNRGFVFPTKEPGLEQALSTFYQDVLDIIGPTGYVTWNPGSLATMTQEVKDVTIYGAAMGDFVLASCSLDISHLTCTAHVSATNTVTIVLFNSTTGTVDLASGTWYIRVFRGIQ